MSYQTDIICDLWVAKKKEEKKVVYRNDIIDDETKAESVWKSILKRKGLPLETKYEYVDKPHKAYDESHCDMLYQTIEEKKKNPEAAKSWGRSTFQWLPPPPPPPPVSSPTEFLDCITLESNFDQRKGSKRIKRSIHGIIYPKGSDAAKKRYQLTIQMAPVKAAQLKELQAKGLADPRCVYAFMSLPEFS